ncbi:MAG: hypothetical protein ACP5PV_09350 [Methanothrix sp.]
MSGFKNVDRDFGRNRISHYEAQNPQLAEQNLTNDLWSWGSSPNEP